MRGVVNCAAAQYAGWLPLRTEFLLPRSAGSLCNACVLRFRHDGQMVSGYVLHRADAADRPRNIRAYGAELEGWPYRDLFYPAHLRRDEPGMVGARGRKDQRSDGKRDESGSI